MPTANLPNIVTGFRVSCAALLSGVCALAVCASCQAPAKVAMTAVVSNPAGATSSAGASGRAGGVAGKASTPTSSTPLATAGRTASAGSTASGGMSATSSGGSTAPAAGGGGGSEAGSGGAGVPVQGACVANPFPLGDISLESSDFTANRDRTLGYLRGIDLDSLLYNFRTTVGLSTGGARAPTGWEAPDSNLRGHATGHVLKALAQAYAGTHDMQYKTKADTLVAELKKCQYLAESKQFGAGYLGAYPPDQFVKLESLAQYPTIWAPYYTMHKILAGLIASYRFTDNATALDMAQQLARWANGRLSKLPRSKLQDMWNLYIAGETGGMNEALAELAEITGDKTFLQTAILFDKDLVIDSCSANEDKLGGLHANQHIPTITGYSRIYDGSGTEKYRSVAENFWNMVTTNHMYVIGGTGEAEMFKAAKAIASALTEKTCESCATYNMLKLTRTLFCRDPDVKYMDYYERGLFNHILGSQDPTSMDAAAVTYFVPLNPGARRTYNNTFTCCHGTGMENHTKYQEQIYSYSSSGDQLYVNLYIASTLHWNQRGFTVSQTTRYPYEPSSQLKIDGAGPLKVALRVPAWATQGVKISVNGTEQAMAAQPGTYAVIDRTWAAGDTIEIAFTFGFRVEKTPDDSSVGAILYGPTVLVATSNKTSLITWSGDGNDVGSAFTPKQSPLTFSANGLDFEPFSKATNVNYHTYFKF